MDVHHATHARDDLVKLVAAPSLQIADEYANNRTGWGVCSVNEFPELGGYDSHQTAVMVEDGVNVILNSKGETIGAHSQQV